ncbi:MAG: phosphate ABC transporter substrate-binding protein [Anaerolineae bacterium]
MHPAKRTLAIVALTTSLVSCTTQAMPASTPTQPTETLRIYATTATLPLLIDLTTAYNGSPPVSFDTYNTNYQTMLDELRSGETPYFLTNHLENNLWAAPVGQDGIAIITHPSLSLDNLTLEQLRDIYQGRTTRWDQLNGDAANIVLFSREAGSGTRAEFERMVMGRRRTSTTALIASSSENMVEQVARTPYSLGYVSIGYLNERVRPLALDGVLPTADNIFNSLYPLRSTIHIVGQQAPTGSYLVFFGWIQSPEGQAIVAQRYVPLM